MIRNNPLKYWDKIAESFKKIYSHNILISGTASEGKSTLVQDLGKYFKAKKFTLIQWILAIITSIVLTYLLGLFLTSINSNQPYTDAATNVLAVYAQLMMVRRYREQWLWWLIIDILFMKMWFVASNMSMFVMYIAWTINCIYDWYNWSKLNKQQNN